MGRSEVQMPRRRAVRAATQRSPFGDPPAGDPASMSRPGRATQQARSGVKLAEVHMSTTQNSTQNGAAAPAGRRMVTQVASLEALVGAHPESLASIYRAGKPADPAELGDAPRGRILAFSKGADLFMVVR